MQTLPGCVVARARLRGDCVQASLELAALGRDVGKHVILISLEARKLGNQLSILNIIAS